MGIGIWQLLIVLVIVVLLFGTKKLKNIGGDLGGAIKSFRSSMRDGQEKPETKQIGEGDGDSDIIEGEVSKEERDKA